MPILTSIAQSHPRNVRGVEIAAIESDGKIEDKSNSRARRSSLDDMKVSLIIFTRFAVVVMAVFVAVAIMFLQKVPLLIRSCCYSVGMSSRIQMNNIIDMFVIFFSFAVVVTVAVATAVLVITITLCCDSRGDNFRYFVCPLCYITRKLWSRASRGRGRKNKFVDKKGGIGGGGGVYRYIYMVVLYSCSGVKN